MRPQKALEELHRIVEGMVSRRRNYPPKSSQYNAISQELHALDWAISLVEFEIDFRKANIANGTWNRGVDAEYLQSMMLAMPCHERYKQASEAE